MHAESSVRRYVVAGSKPWNRRVFEEVVSSYPGEWLFFGSLEELSLARLGKIEPRHIFLNWSWKIPEEIINNLSIAHGPSGHSPTMGQCGVTAVCRSF